MITRILGIFCVMLSVLLVAAIAAVWVLKGDVSDLAAEKATLQSRLGAAIADIEISTKNHDRMMAEKDAVIASERRIAEANLQVKAQVAATHEDIAHAPDSQACTDSAPVGAALDGMRKLERAGPFLKPVDRLPPASRAGKVAKPGIASGTGGRVGGSIPR